jgi:hypothetical protein
MVMTELGVETNRIEVEGGRTKVERVWFILIVLDCLGHGIGWGALGLVLNLSSKSLNRVELYSHQSDR